MDKIYSWITMAITLMLLTATIFAQAPDTVWTRMYNSPYISDDFARGCAIDGSGNLCVTGYTTTGILSIKYSAAGDTLWTRRYNGANNSFGCKADDSSNIYAVGFSLSDHAYFLIIKYNSSGDTLWTRMFHDSDVSDGCAYGCAIDGSGNLYVTGYTYDSINFYGCLTIKYNAAGDTLWTRRYYGSAGTWAFGCAVDSAGNVYVTGQDWATADYLTIKYNASGDTLWTRRYNASINEDCARGCAVDNSGNVYVTGYCNNDVTYSDYLTIKYNSAGDTLWTRRYNGPANSQDYAYSCIADGAGNLYVTGSSMDGTNTENFLTIKYNPTGDTLWTRRDIGPLSNQAMAHGCVVDSLGMLYVTGYTYDGIGNYKFLTIKYNTTTGVAGKPEYPMVGCKLRLEQNMPNPFNQNTTISYQLPASGITKLNIYNATGQLVKAFDLGQQRAGYHQVEWRDQKIPAGVYFYRLTSGNSQVTKKLLVVK